MPKVRSTAAIAEKWARVTPQRSEDYRKGVADPKVDWSQATQAAHERYKAGVIAAANEGRQLAGVKKAGTKKWQDKAASVGPSRFSEGVSVAAPDFEKGFAPFRDVIEKTTLPERYPKGDPRNWDRSRVLGIAMNKAKTGKS